MTQNTRSAKVILDYEVRGVPQAVVAQTKLTEQTKAGAVHFANEAQAAAALGISLERLGVKAAGVKTTEVSGANTQLDTERKITAEMEKQIAANDRAARGSTGGIGGADGKLSTGFGTLRAAGAAFGNLGGGQGLTQVASFVGLGAELGVLGLAAGATAIILKQLTAEQERQQKVYEARLDVERSATREVATLTSEQVRERIRAAEQLLAIDTEVARQQLANAALYNIEISTQPLKLAAALAGLDPLYNAYLNATAKNAVALEGGAAALDVYYQSLTDGSTDAADATARALASDERKIASEEAFLEADKKTAEQRATHIAELQAEIDSKQRLLDVGNLNTATETALIDAIRLLNIEQNAYKNTLDSTADKLERIKNAQEAVTAANDAYLASLDLEADAKTELAKIDAEILQIGIERQEKLTALEQETNERRLEIGADGGEALAELEAKSARDRAKILRDSGTDLRFATFRRDALAAYLAQQALKVRLEDQRANDEEQQQRLDKSLKKQLAAQDKNSQRQAEQANKAADTQLRLQKQAQARQNAALQSALLAQTTVQANQLALTKNFYAQALVATQTFITDANAKYALLGKGAAVAGGGGGGGGSQPIGGAYQAQLERDRQAAIALAYAQYSARSGALGFGAGPVPRYASGIANVPHTQLAMLHAGERVLNPQQNRLFSSLNAGGGSRVININFDGKAIRATSKAMAMEAIDEFLDMD